MAQLTHLDGDGRPRMVDVSEKAVTARVATASARVILGTDVRDQLAQAGYATKKGSIAQIAIIAGTQAIKQTWSVIPLCHALPISGCRITVEPEADVPALRIECTVKTTGQTGVEMEALHGATVAALTVYDMTKALSHDVRITDVQLEHKSGGKRDFTRKG